MQLEKKMRNILNIIEDNISSNESNEINNLSDWENTRQNAN